MNTFIVKYVKKIGKNKKIIQSLINEIVSWFSIFSIETEERHYKCDNSYSKTNKTTTNKKKCSCNKYKKKIYKLLYTIETEKKLMQIRINNFVDEIERLTYKNTKLETENNELKEKLKHKNFKSQNVFTLMPIYVSIYD